MALSQPASHDVTPPETAPAQESVAAPSFAPEALAPEPAPPRPQQGNEVAEDADPSPPPAAPAPETASADHYSNDYSSFAHEPPFRPRRNPAKLWTMAAIAFAVLSLAVLGAVARYGLPQWLSLGAGGTVQTQPDLVLSFPPNRQDRRTLPNGAEFFGVSGTIVNIGKQRRAVPTLLIVLRDAQNRLVYSWEVTSPKPVLAPGEVVPIVEAVTDIPKSAKVAEIGWKPN